MICDPALNKVLPVLLGEIREVLEQVKQEELEALADLVVRAKRVFLCGAGRVGTASRALAMRLVHLGKSAFWVPDDTTPSIGPGDLLVANSGSGGSVSTCSTASMAKKAGALVATITANPDGKIARLADAVLLLPAQTYKSDRCAWGSILPLGSQFELCLWILQDLLALALMKKLGIEEEQMIGRHRNLE